LLKCGLLLNGLEPIGCRSQIEATMNEALNRKWKFYVAVVERFNVELTKELMAAQLTPKERAEALPALEEGARFWLSEYPPYPIPY